jgi:hypothetical protein
MDAILNITRTRRKEMTHDEMIEIIQAHKDGKQIEFRKSVSKEPWRDLNGLMFDFALFTYRVKSSQKKILYQYNYITSNGVVYKSGRFYSSRAEAERVTGCKIIGPALETKLEI